MAKFVRLAGALVAALSMALGMPAQAFAQDRDAQEIESYKLTDSGLAKFKQATEKLRALNATCKEGDEEDSDSPSIDEMVAELNALPGAQAAIQSSGLSTREYIVFSWSILQTGLAAWAVSQPGGKLPPGVSQANVDFYNKHEAEFAALGDSDRCDDDADETET